VNLFWGGNKDSIYTNKRKKKVGGALCEGGVLCVGISALTLPQSESRDDVVADDVVPRLHRRRVTTMSANRSTTRVRNAGPTDRRIDCIGHVDALLAVQGHVHVDNLCISHVDSHHTNPACINHFDVGDRHARCARDVDCARFECNDGSRRPRRWITRHGRWGDEVKLLGCCTQLQEVPQ
jgi:hypothetical protein